jgi:hypothetical protein
MIASADSFDEAMGAIGEVDRMGRDGGTRRWWHRTGKPVVAMTKAAKKKASANYDKKFAEALRRRGS